MTDLTSPVSPYVDWQFPEFVRENHPRFLEFIRAYYQWMESQNQVLSIAKKIPLNQDIDTAESQYLERLFREFLTNIPRSMLSDKSILLKNVKQFYRARGTEKSYKLFFRFLYDLNVEFYYPRVDVLRVSDGKWIQQKSIRVFAVTGQTLNLQSQRVRGVKSNCTAYVERVLSIQEGDYLGYELVLNVSSITGEFLAEELIESEDGTITARISAVPISARVTHPGEGYSAGMRFTVNQVGVGAVVEIASVDSIGAIQKLTIVNFGLGYQTSLPVTNYPLNASVIDIANIDLDLGALISYAGFYLNEDGQLSTFKFIHDGHFYQQFSYVLFVGETLSTYDSLVKRVLHPAGFRLFGGFRSENILDAATKLLSQNANIFTRKLTSDVLDAKSKIQTTVVSKTESRRASTTYPLGPTRYSVYRERYHYKPVAKYNANSELSHIPNYFGIFGDLSNQKANTPVSIFHDAGLTPANIETMLHQVTNLLPDAVIKTETEVI